MSFSIQYRQLFSLDMLHDFYLSEDLALYEDDPKLKDAILPHQQKNYQLNRDLDISPTPDCRQILNDNRLVFKPTSRGFFVAAKVREIPAVSPIFSPFTPLDEHLCLRFKVEVKNPFFTNFTNFRIDKNEARGQRYLYYFSNRANNSQNLLYLSQVIPTHNPSQEYFAGDLHRSGVKLFEALQDVPANGSINDYWKQIYKDQTPFFQFITHLDRLALRPSVFDHRVFNVAQNHQELKVLVFNVDDQLVDTQHFTAYDPAAPNATLQACSLDLRKMKPGVHRLEVRKMDDAVLVDFGLKFYLDTALYQQGTLALIECFHNPNDNTSPYRWLDTANQNNLRQPQYQLRWKNRSTFWRYYLAKPKTEPTVEPDKTTWEPGTDPRILITAVTRPLAQVFTRIEFSGNGAGQPQLLPNPELNTIVYENGRVYSEINLGGGLG